jgi:hypothetical protein
MLKTMGGPEKLAARSEQLAGALLDTLASADVAARTETEQRSDRAVLDRFYARSGQGAPAAAAAPSPLIAPGEPSTVTERAIDAVEDEPRHVHAVSIASLSASIALTVGIIAAIAAPWFGFGWIGWTSVVVFAAVANIVMTGMTLIRVRRERDVRRPRRGVVKPDSSHG